MRLSKTSISKISETPTLVLPDTNAFALPEKVLQFGTGILLRGLPDFIINNAINKGTFNGRIVVVKSTATGDTDAFTAQDGLYTLCVRGIHDGKKVEENQIIASISRVLSATNEWDSILECAANPDMQVIISNTTEVGIVLTQDNIHHTPPHSFPGKLVAFLYQRFKYFNGDIQKGMVIIPTELIPNNGDILLSIVLELAHQNNLETSFIDWIENANYFCSSLVDRIVPGKLQPAEQEKVEAALGYTDELMIISEPYSLWAIESDNERVKEILSFAKGDNSVVLAPNINKFRELKLRLLNGSHTFSCGLAHLAGFTTVKESMDDASFASYIQQLMYKEIVPAICSAEINKEDAETFAGKVLDRYRNSFIEHKWLSITMQYSSKMNTRNVDVIQHYLTRFKQVPVNMALGVAGHILFMKGEGGTDGNYYGVANGNRYWINDNNAAFYASAWKENDINTVVEKILGNENLWQTNLAGLQVFKTEVVNWLNILIESGAVAALAIADKQTKEFENEK